MKVEVNEEGVQTRGFAYSPCRKPEPWSAEWIWLDSTIYPDYQSCAFSSYMPKEKQRFRVALFRKEISLTHSPEKVTAWVSADTRYRIYINGRLAGRGPAEPGGDWGDTNPTEHWFYDDYDLTPRFQKGSNVISVEVAMDTGIESHYSMGRGGLLFETEARLEDGKTEKIVTDASWRAIPGEAFVAVDRYDARKEPTGWQLPGYDDDQWSKVQRIGIPPSGPWNLLPREVPPLMEAALPAERIIVPFDEFKERIKNPKAMLRFDDSVTTIGPGSDISFWVDFGKEVVGHPKLTVSGSEGTRIDLAYEEIAGKAHRTDTYILREGLQTYEIFHLEGYRYVRVTVGALDNPLELIRFSTTFTSYPVEYIGEFSCSEELLNRIWKVGRWTNQICMQGYHLDSPIHQEPLSDPGDYLIESLINYCTFGVPWLVRQDLLRIAYLLRSKKGLMFHTSYSLLWLQMIVDYYTYTGDETLVATVAPIVHQLMNVFEGYQGKTGLIDWPPNYMFMDWVHVGDFNLHHPPRIIGQGYLTAFYYKALRNGAQISVITGDEERRLRYEGLAASVSEAFHHHLWDDARGLYRDGTSVDPPLTPNRWLPPDENGPYFSQHTNALAVAYDLAPRDLHRAIIWRILEDRSLIQAQPYFMHFIFEGIHHAGLFEEHGLKQIRRWAKLLAEHPSSWKEVWGNAGFDCDYSHAWSGTPTYQLSTRVLGITPAAAGFKEINVKPCLGDLRWARGVIPSGYGKIEAEGSITPRGMVLDVTLPTGTMGHIYIPKIGRQPVTVTEKNQAIWTAGSLKENRSSVQSASENDNYITFDVLPGSYHFEVISAS